MGDLEGAQQALVEELVRRQAGNVLAVPRGAARVRGHAGRYAVEEGGLAGAGGADQAGNAGWADRKARAIHGAEATEMLVEVVDLDHAGWSLSAQTVTQGFFMRDGPGQ